MRAKRTISLMTPTWSGDLEHYRLLMASLPKSPLTDLPHLTVVQTEDMPTFAGLAPGTTQLLPSREILPGDIEARRVRALRYQKALGRHFTRVAGSTCRTLGWPTWPRYTGWHTQQITKLAVAAGADTDYLLVLDSDVIVTPSADLSDILAAPEIVCYSVAKPLREFKGKTRNWVLQADALLSPSDVNQEHYDSYFDTPFLLHTPTVRAMLQWLEQRYRQPWWQVLLNQPPRRWSEFATYKLFLAQLSQSDPGTSVDWLSPDRMHYIFDASDPDRLVAQLRARLTDPATHFITVHSQSGGRQLWSAADFSDRVLELL